MPGTLGSIRVLDMTVWQQGTSASAMLTDLGADVIKIEEPSGGDPGRGVNRGEQVGGLSGYFQALSRGKRSLALDLKHPKGREVFLRLARDADVFLTNFRPGVAEHLGIGYSDVSKVNPRIIYARAPRPPGAGAGPAYGVAQGGPLPTPTDRGVP